MLAVPDPGVRGARRRLGVTGRIDQHVERELRQDGAVRCDHALAGFEGRERLADGVAHRELVASEAGPHEPLAGAVDVDVGERAHVEMLEAAIARRERDAKLADADDAGADGTGGDRGEQGLIVHGTSRMRRNSTRTRRDAPLPPDTRPARRPRARAAPGRSPAYRRRTRRARGSVAAEDDGVGNRRRARRQSNGASGSRITKSAAAGGQTGDGVRTPPRRRQRRPDRARAPVHGVAAETTTLAAPVQQPLAVFEPAQFLDRRRRHVAVRADAPGAAVRADARQRKDAVAEVGFGGRAQTATGAAGGERGGFGVASGASRAPGTSARHRRGSEQPFDRALAAPAPGSRRTSCRLLGDVDVDRRVGVDRVAARRALRAAPRAARRAASAARGRCARRSPRSRCAAFERSRAAHRPIG